jgi:hypothetical protein
MSRRRTRTAESRTPSAPDDTAPSPLASAVAVALSVATSALGSLALPAQVRIHWTLGRGPYYGPETAPTVAVLVLFPVLVAGVALGARRFRGRAGADGTAGPYGRLVAWSALAVLLGTQGLLVAANL